MKTLLLTGLFAAGLWSTAFGQGKSTGSPSENEATIRRMIEEVYSGGHFERMAEFISENFVGQQGAKGPQAAAAPIRGLHESFPDIHWTIEDVVAAGDRVVVRWVWHGTHRAPFNGSAATGKMIESKAIAIYRLENGKVVETWLQNDRLGFLQQLGVVDASLGQPKPAKP